jgi:hypothetical protein
MWEGGTRSGLRSSVIERVSECYTHYLPPSRSFESMRLEQYPDKEVARSPAGDNHSPALPLCPRLDAVPGETPLNRGINSVGVVLRQNTTARAASRNRMIYSNLHSVPMNDSPLLEPYPCLQPVAATSCRRRLPPTRLSITHKFSVNGHEG